MRLTYRLSNGECIPNPENDLIIDKETGYRICINKLAEYEDLEETGRLVKLPCKAGDTVYVIRTRKRNGRYADTAVAKMVQSIEIGKGGYIGVRLGTTDWENANRVFLTREAAEAALINENNQK